MNTDVYRLGILISGRGSNMRAILNAQSGKIMPFITGDICTRDRPGITGANIPKCRTLIMECTFGMPQFRFPPIDSQAISEMYHATLMKLLKVHRDGTSPLEPFYTMEIAKIRNI